MAIIIHRLHINCNMCKPENLNEAVTLGEDIDKIDTDKGIK